MQHTTLEFKLADSTNEMGLFEGYGSVFGNIDLGGDIVERGAFSKSLDAWNEKNEMPAMFGFHDMGNPIGDWLEMREDDRGLYVKGQLWVKGEQRIESAVVAHNIMKGTGPKGLSIGYRVRDYENMEFEGGMVRRLKEIDLLEVSVVGFAMNPEARVTAAKSLTDEDGKILTKREVERILRDVGLSTRQAKAFIAGGYEALNRDEEEKQAAENRDDSLDMSGILASLNNLSTNLKGR